MNWVPLFPHEIRRPMNRFIEDLDTAWRELLETTRTLTEVVHAEVDAVNAMARGDLTVPLDVSSKDEIGHMAQALTTAQRALRDTLEQVAR